ncbi:hypothetical protein B566_EDAN005297 [Ephemera danica]|nr:hypothetical protein B566_EDAN005297 [Ephemera danica]
MEPQGAAKVGDKNPPGEGKKKNVSEIREAFKLVMEISDLLRTNLNPEMLAVCIRLIEEGANPDALARIVAEMSRETEKLDNECKG